MKKEDIPFNMEFSIDEVLRERADDPSSMKQGVKFLREKLEEADDVKVRASILSMIGTYERILIELSESEMAYVEAIELCKSEGKKLLGLRIKLNLAVTYQWKKKFDKADNIFVETINKLKDTDEPKLQKLLEFAYQNYGKSLFEQHRFDVAQENFVSALELRLASGDMNLIEDTQNCINKTKEFIEKMEEEENEGS